MKTLLALAAAGLLAALGVACAGVTDLDVKYTDAGASTTSTSGGNGGGNSTDASLAPDAPPIHVAPASTTPVQTAVPSCGDCDTTAGMGCCLSGGATCLSQADYATSCPANGVFVGCFQPTADAECCWHDINGSKVALAGTICQEGYACLVDTDCPEGTGTCATTNCHGVTIGQCGKAPACP